MHNNSYYRVFFRGLNAKKTSKIIHRENEMEVKTCYRLLNFEYKKICFFYFIFFFSRVSVRHLGFGYVCEF